MSSVRVGTGAVGAWEEEVASLVMLIFGAEVLVDGSVGAEIGDEGGGLVLELPFEEAILSSSHPIDVCVSELLLLCQIWLIIRLNK